MIAISGHVCAAVPFRIAVSVSILPSKDPIYESKESIMTHREKYMFLTPAKAEQTTP